MITKMFHCTDESSSVRKQNITHIIHLVYFIRRRHKIFLNFNKIYRHELYLIREHMNYTKYNDKVIQVKTLYI